MDEGAIVQCEVCDYRVGGQCHRHAPRAYFGPTHGAATGLALMFNVMWPVPYGGCGEGHKHWDGKLPAPDPDLR
jgi:hypothetical protein